MCNVDASQDMFLCKINKLSEMEIYLTMDGDRIFVFSPASPYNSSS